MNSRQNPYEAAFTVWRRETVTSQFLDMPMLNQLKAAYFAGVKFGKDVAEEQLMKELAND